MIKIHQIVPNHTPRMKHAFERNATEPLSMAPMSGKGAMQLKFEPESG